MNSNKSYNSYHHGHLKHFQPKGGTFFITFNIKTNLPKSFLESIEKEKERLSSSLKHIEKISERNVIFYKKLFAFSDSYFDLLQCEQNYLTDSKLAQIIVEQMMLHDNKCYNLHCYTIMPNHVHMLCRMLPDETGEDYTLSYIMSKIKGISAYLINKELQRTGTFWQKNYYDHVVRNDIEFQNIIRYIVMNPVKANLVSDYKLWAGTWVAKEFEDFIGEEQVDYGDSPY
jgi:putative transposase